jgi:molybdate transport system substrate-binding protein
MMPSWRLRREFLALLAPILFAPGCARDDASPTGSHGPPLHIAAASDLQRALPELVDRFERNSPGRKVVLTFGSSGQLSEQIRAGAPFDLFLSANTAFVDKLASERHIDPRTVRPYAIGRLVIAIGSEQLGKVARIEDLASAAVVKVAIANPEYAPYGMAAKQALERSGLWSALAPKLVLAETVGQAMQFVQSGNTEAGLVSKSVAIAPEIRVIEVDPASYDPLVQSLGIVTRSMPAEAAESFAQFLTGVTGQAMLKSHGFEPPPATNTP